MKKKEILIIAIGIGGLLILSSYFLPWWPANPISPFRYLLANLLARPLPLMPGGEILFLYALPNLASGLIVLLGVFLYSRKGIYWISLIAAIWSLLTSLFWWCFPIGLTLDSYPRMSWLEAASANFAPGTYIGIAGSIIVLIGLLLHKFWKQGGDNNA